MTRAGRALREKWELERLAAQPCPQCGHGLGEHRELQDIFVIDDAEKGLAHFELHPDHVVGEFHCNHDGCDCILRR